MAQIADDNEEISEMLQFIPEVGEIFDVQNKIGEGTFSKVFRAVVKQSVIKREFALKYLIPTIKPSSIASELLCLKEIGGTNNVIGIEFCFMNKGHVVIVMPYFPHLKFSEYVRRMTVDDTRDYMKNLFIAIAKVHSLGIIHRDIKPNNFLYNEETKKYSLVDFGLAQRMSDLECWRRSTLRSDSENASKRCNEEMPSTSTELMSNETESLKECGCFNKPSVCKICLGRDPEDAPRGGTRGSRAPEVLLRYNNQTTAIDMWSAGVILLSILSKKYPFFRADDDMTALAEIAFIVGTKQLEEAAESIGKVITMNLPDPIGSVSEIREQLTPNRWLRALCLLVQRDQPCFIHYPQPKLCCDICHAHCNSYSESAFDLLNRLLDSNPHTRLTALEALRHPFITNEDLSSSM